MFSTGNSILFAFSLAAILLPLFPLLMLLIRRVPIRQKATMLIILCLLAFLRQVLLIATVQKDPALINAVFNIAEMAILVILYHEVILNDPIKHLLSLMLVSIISITATIYSLEGVAAYGTLVPILLSLFILGFSLIAIWHIITNEHLFILHHPVFWIAGGTLCYFAMFLLSEFLKTYEVRVSANTEKERFILMAAVYMVRYVFFIIAAWVMPSNDDMPEKPFI